MKKFLPLVTLLLLQIFFYPNTMAQQNWYSHFAGPDDQSLTDVRKDSEGNWILCGTFKDEMDADPGAGTYNLTTGSYDEIYVIKLNTSGEFIWAMQIGSSHQDFVWDIDLDPENNIYIAGSFQGLVDFDPGAGIAEYETSGSPFNSSNMYLAKYSPQGTYINAWHFPSEEADVVSKAMGIDVDSDGNILLVGNIYGPIDLDPTSGSMIVTPLSDFSDFVVIKMGADGNFLWGQLYQGEIGDSGQDIITDDQGNIYVTGSFRSNIDFDPGIGTAFYAPQGDDTFNDIFLLSLFPNGALRWIKTIGWSETQIGSKLDISPEGDLYLAGNFSGTVDFDPEPSTEILLTAEGFDDLFIAKLSTEGDLQWARSWGGPSSATLYNINTDVNGQVAVAGSFVDNMDLGQHLFGAYLSAAGGSDGFALNWSADGNLTDYFAIGGAENDRLSVCIPATSGTHYYLGGSFEEDIHFDPSDPNAMFTASDDKDAFFVYFNPDVLTAVNADIQPGRGWLLSPNPGKDQVSLLPQDRQYNSLTLRDAQGRTCYTWNEWQNSFDISTLKPGMYFLEINGEQGVTVLKLLIE